MSASEANFYRNFTFMGILVARLAEVRTMHSTWLRWEQTVDNDRLESDSFNNIQHYVFHMLYAGEDGRISTESADQMKRTAAFVSELVSHLCDIDILSDQDVNDIVMRSQERK